MWLHFNMLDRYGAHKGFKTALPRTCNLISPCLSFTFFKKGPALTILPVSQPLGRGSERQDGKMLDLRICFPALTCMLCGLGWSLCFSEPHFPLCCEVMGLKIICTVGGACT